MDDTTLRTIWQQRQFDDRYAPVAQPLTMLMKRVLAKRVRQLGDIGTVWDDVLPRSIRDHTALESFNRGVLTVLVDSAAHRYQLQMLLNGGVEREIRARFKGALNKVRLVPGQFYAVDLTGAARYEF